MLKDPGNSPHPEMDPLRYRVDLPHRSTFYPMGYPVEISTNSTEALAVAAKLWRKYPVLSNASPVRIRVISSGEGVPPDREPLPPRGQGHLLSIVHGIHDFAVADLTAGFAFASLSQSTISDHSLFRYYFLEPLAYVMQAARHFAFVHASCISRQGKAIVLCGDSGSGKTCLAYACAKQGWDFVSGDAVHIVRGAKDRMVIGRPYEIRFRDSARSLFPELASVPSELRASGKIDMEIDTAELGIPLALNSSAHRIVFVQRAAETRLIPWSVEGAMRKLEETVCFGDDETRREQRETLADFATAPICGLEYADPYQAERTLAKLLKVGHAC